MTVEIRPLTPSGDRASFRSGDAALDLYFHRYAGQSQFRHHLGVTYVAVAGDVLVGFVTVTPGSVEADALPGGGRMPPYPIPVLRVARLAVAENARGAGLGKALLRFALELGERLQDEVGCVGLLVDAEAGAVDFYRRFGFVPAEAAEGETSIIPRPQLMFLPLGAVPARRPR